MIKRNLVANYIGQIWSAVMSIAFIPLYIKYLGIESYGLIGLFGMVLTWLGLLDLGMTPTLSREMARYTGGAHTAGSIRNLLRSIECLALIIAFVIGLKKSANFPNAGTTLLTTNSTRL
jgi:O-antigen/teichoic acid export membrane protein